MDNLDLHTLRIFLAVIEARNFTEAGRIVNLSQPAISHKIKSLEQALDVRLFERYGPLKVKPTEDALKFQKLVLPLIRDARSLKARFDEVRGKIHKSEIRIVSHDSVIAYFFPEIVARFKKSYPHFKFRFKRGGQEEILSSILTGDMELGITTLDPVPRGIEYRAYGKHRYMLITSKDHPLGRVTKPTLKEISNYPFILPPAPSKTRDLIDGKFKKAGLSIEVAVEIGERNAVINYVQKGLGISILADYYLFPQDYDRIARTDLSYLLDITYRGIFWRKGKLFSDTQKELIELIKTYRHC